MCKHWRRKEGMHADELKERMKIDREEQKKKEELVADEKERKKERQVN